MSQAKALLEIIQALIATVEAVPEGIPSGHLYAQLMTKGCSLEQFKQIESIMVGSGKVVKKGDLLLKA